MDRIKKEQINIGSIDEEIKKTDNEIWTLYIYIYNQGFIFKVRETFDYEIC